MELISATQAAQELGVTTRWIQRLCKDGRLGQKVGKQYIITRQDLDKFKSIPRKVGKPAKAS